MSATEAAEEAPGEGEREYAGLGRRALAALIDNASWLVFYSFFIGGFVAAVYEESPEAAGVIVLVFLSAWFNYFSFAEWRWGQTIGKNAAGIEVASLTGERVTFAQASTRNLLRLVDFFVVGWVMVAAGARRQRLGDKAAKTVVVRRPPRGAPAAPSAPAAGVAGTAMAAAGEPPPPAITPPPVAPPQPEPEGTAGGRAFDWVTWTPGDVAMGILAAALISTLATLVLVLPFDPELETTGGQLLGQVALWGTLVGVALAGATDWRFQEWGEALRRLGFRDFRWSHLKLAGLTVLAYLAFAVVAAGLLDALFGYTPEQEELSETLDLELTPVAVVALYLSACVIAPLTEETFFRGFVFAGVRARYGFWAGAIVSSLIFGAVHAGTGPAAIPFLAVLGGAFAYLYERSGSLWPAVIAHALNNLLAITVQVAA
ncbi:MAG: CPBP family glutamic-type intramembrane protease [Solirubrobacterales bacterium]